MTRPTLPTSPFLQTSSAGTAAIISNPEASFWSNLVTYVNTIQADLDTAGIPATTGLVETKTSGTLSVSVGQSNLSVTGTVAFTLPDGSAVGQVKVLECTVAASTPAGTVTITTPLSGEPSTHVFNATAQALTLVWQTGGWHIVRKHRAGVSPTLVVGTTVTTGMDMNAVYNLSITGTVTSTSTMALPDPTVGDTGLAITITCSVAATCPAGTLDGNYLDTANAAKTHLAVNATTDTALFVASNGKWRQVVLTSTTLS